MTNDHKSQIAIIEKHIDVSSDYFKQLSNMEDLKRFKDFIIHKPGWTTPAELAFAIGIAQSLELHARATLELKNVLIKGSELVVTK